MKMTKNNIVKIGGKTFEKCGNEYLRIHDEKYCGKKTVYGRCGVCGKLVSRQWQRYHRSIHINE